MKTAVVTGTSYGIGKAIAQKLLSLGYKVYGISRTESKLDNHDFVWIKADLSDAKQIKFVTSQIKENKVDVLINNAGISYKKDAKDFDKSDFEKIFSLNYFAPVELTKLLQTKLENETIITVTSDLAKLSLYGYAIYCSSKAAISAYFRVFAMENENIKVVNVMPGMV